MFVFGPPNLRRSRNNWHGDPCSLWPSCSRRRILVGSVQALLYFICQEWKVSQGPEFWNPLQRYLIIASLVVYYYDEPQHHGNIFTYKNTCLILQYVAYFPVIRNTKLIFANIYVLRKSSTHHQSLVSKVFSERRKFRPPLGHGLLKKEKCFALPHKVANPIG